MAKRKTRTPARRTGARRAPARRTRRRSSGGGGVKSMLSDATDWLPLFAIRYMTDMATAKAFLPWPALTVPLLTWFISLKRELIGGMRKVSAYMVGDALYDHFMGYKRVAVPKGTSGADYRISGQSPTPAAFTPDDVDNLIRNVNLRSAKGDAARPMGQSPTPATFDSLHYNIE